jgi:photosystem II stability/assembly factor-like uncharacterized protein
MSRIPLALALSLVLATVSTAAPPPSYDDAALRAVQFVDAREGWAAGDDGVIWHSIDGGQTWERQKSGTRATLTGIHFLTPYTGYVVGRNELPGDLGSSGVLLATADGGITWNEVASGVLPGLNAVTFFDEKNGLVCGDSCGAYPGGAFTTADGGKSWRPMVGPLGGSWLALDGKSAKEAMLVGAWGKSAAIKDGELKPINPAQMNIPGSRSIRAVKSNGETAFAVGDGGLVVVNRQYPIGAGAKHEDLRFINYEYVPGSWRNVELPLADARGVCDFHSVSMVGDNVWIAGRPGSIVLHSPDAGKSWTIQKTDSQVPLHAIQMLDAKTGWAVGDLGTVLMTTDGGQKWKHCRGKLHAAVLGAHASPKSVPLTMYPVVGAAEGYLTATVSFTSADATADPRRAAEPFRLAAAMRLAGGAASESLWAFPLPGHCDGLTADQLRAYWDGLHDGKAADQLVRQMTLAIRMWRPEVIVTDSVMPDAPAAEQLVLATAQEAFKRAADPAAYPEQIATLGLRVHAVKKLYGSQRNAFLSLESKVKLDLSGFRDSIADTPDSMAFDSERLLNSLYFSGVQLVSHRMNGVENHTDMMEGCALAHGGMARRIKAGDVWQFAPEFLDQRRKASILRNLDTAKLQRPRTSTGIASLQSLIEPPTASEKWTNFPKHIAHFAPDDAVELTIKEAMACSNSNRAESNFAREYYQYAVEHYPTQPATLPAYRWLARYHASSETLRRIELGHMASLRPTEFYELPKDDIQQVGHTEAKLDRAKFRTSEAMRGWYGTGPALEAKLFAVNPLLSREPSEQLAFHAARLKLGLTADAEKAMGAYYRTVVGRAVTPGANPWFDALAAELHLMNPKLMPTNPKPVAACAKVAGRPILDGKLDDDAWTGTTELTLKDGSRELAGSHATTARMAFDEEYLYLGVTCRHPNGEQVPPAETRKHDDDVAPHDRVELMLDLDRDYSTYYRLRVDHRGCTAEDCWGDSSWNPKWFVAVHPTATGWTAEVAIPLAELTGRRPTDKSAWAFNLTRVLPGRGVLAWNGPGDGTPRPEAMGHLEFRGK